MEGSEHRENYSESEPSEKYYTPMNHSVNSNSTIMEMMILNHHAYLQEQLKNNLPFDLNLQDLYNKEGKNEASPFKRHSEDIVPPEYQNIYPQEAASFQESRDDVISLMINLPPENDNLSDQNKSGTPVSYRSVIRGGRNWNAERLWDGFNKSFEAHNQKDLFVKAFAHHVSQVLRKKQIVNLKHKGGFVGGPSPELQSQFRMRAFFLFCFLGLLWCLISLRMFEISGETVQFIGIPILGVIHTFIVIFEMEAVTFYETYSKWERLTLGMDILKYIFLYGYIVEYDNFNNRKLMAYLVTIPFVQKVVFFI